MIPVRKIILSLFGLIFIDQVYATLITPLLTLVFFDPSSRLFLPDVTHATRSLWFGLCVALPNAINMFIAPWLSSLSDEWGRKRILALEMFSSFVFGLFASIGIFYGQIIFLFIGFMIKGAFARSNPTALAIIGDTAPPMQKLRYMGNLQLAISIGAFIGPMLGGFLASRYFFARLNFSVGFIVAALLALMNSLLCLYFMPETLRKPFSRKYLPSWQTVKRLFFLPQILSISIILFLIQLSWSMYYQYMPPILKTTYHFTNHQLGFFISLIALWLALATSLGIKWLDQFFTTRKILLISMWMTLIGLLITLLACANLLPFHLSWLWIGAMPVAAGDVIAYSCLSALYSDHVAHDEQGKVMGISFIIVSASWSLTALCGGFLLSLNPIFPLIFAPLGMLAGIFYTMRHPSLLS